jgi:phosphate:Na+ symporter
VFSNQALNELDQLFQKATKAFTCSMEALDKNDHAIAQKAIQLESESDMMEEELKKNHYDRLKKGTCKPESGPMYLEIIMNLGRVTNHAENIARGVIMGF